MKDATKNPLISVIIPAKDDAERLSVCLKCLEEQNYPKEAIEVVIADNGSKEPINVPANYSISIQVVRENKHGSYAARNAAMAVAKGDVFAFTDSDCLPDESWLSEGIKFLMAYNGLVAGEMRVTPQNDQQPNAAEAYEMLTAFPQKDYVKRGFGVTANLFAERKVYEHIGGFDASLKSGGDMEWCRQAGRAGFRIHHAPEAIVVHPARRSYTAIKQKLIRTLAGIDSIERRNSLDNRSSLNRLKRLFYLTLPPVKTIWRIVKSKQFHGFRLKLATAMITIRLRYAYAFEGWRLFFGGKYRW